ncbi:MAG TPA: hypothetical protein VKB77_00030 [Terriglobales bacterium]|nr:hypothetical protein [Terriglobales bacterium]
MREQQDIDRWLDEALSRYVDVEPRPGLESRMVARLAAEQPAPRTISWWALAFGTAAFAGLVLLWLRPALQPVNTPDMRWTAQLPPVVLSLQHTTSPTAAAARSKQSRSATLAGRSKEAKQERFPSPSPLTEQEKMLARFVESFPQRAALVAQTQTELYQQDQKEMARPWPAKEND